jgi:hypothetical protein
MNDLKRSLGSVDSIELTGCAESNVVAEFPETTATEPIGINGIVNTPVIALVKAESGWVGYVLEDGLTSLTRDRSPSTLTMNENVRANGYNTALILNPVTLAASRTPALQPVRELPVSRIVIPENTRVSSVARAAARGLPILLFLEAEDFASRRYENVVDYGVIDLATWIPTNI